MAVSSKISGPERKSFFTYFLQNPIGDSDSFGRATQIAGEESLAVTASMACIRTAAAGCWPRKSSIICTDQSVAMGFAIPF